MEKTGQLKRKFGLVGKNISYSFSSTYFSKKFEEKGLDNHSYENFDLTTIAEFPKLLEDSNLAGLNVTIPYKEQVLPFLNDIDTTAKEIGAVNTIKFTANGIKGFNTDAIGFKQSLKPHLTQKHCKGLILGTGGASKAIAYIFKELDIAFKYVSRTKRVGHLTYSELSKEIIQEYLVIVNCTPIGTFPNIEEKPNIPYQYIGNEHLLFDLIYNPEKTNFLKLGEEKGAKIQNGYPMLVNQAEAAWHIWNS
ncbi:shikimate 5-dehydrogenase [Croceivirga lutea]|uniref:shikimate dehydrogenase family protein n=1 Tax=Croceivirga lutea TaxID=1775167 RepID=UPI00163B3D9A|nr:shikimate dehydrogenase [Croceivirga lutea]GGG49023.1 shikimate 5-dehydrogenase [Croceivirga lutea]